MAGPSFRALIVEDSPMIALDLEAGLVGWGASEVRIAGSPNAAAGELETFRPDIAILDLGLGGPGQIELALGLVALGVKVIFTAAGIGRPVLPGALGACPVVAKPYGPQHMELAVRRALGLTN